MTTPDVVLKTARYGKDKVRVFRVKREGDGVHYIVEYNVTLLVEGDIDASYTQADNSVVVATDSMKNMTYYLAKVSDFVLVPEFFALHLGTHVLSRYAHLKKAFVTVEQLRWSRITVGEEDKPHPHAFHRDGDEKRIVRATLEKQDDRLSAKVVAGIVDLLVLKSTGSAFEGFIRDEYTTLVEVSERILSTSIDLEYCFAPVSIPIPTDAKLLDFATQHLTGSVWDALGVAERARRATLDLFATDESASVQATLFKMGQRVIAENAGVDEVMYQLPNKHYIPVDMKYIDVDNMTLVHRIGYSLSPIGPLYCCGATAVKINDAGGMIDGDPITAKAEVFVPVAAPSGLISATISRKQL